MKAKQSKQLGKLLAFASAIVGLVAVIMIFLPQIVAANENSDTAYNGIAIAFGKTLYDKLGITSKIDFSFLNLLCYLLVVVGLVLTVLQICGICKSKLVTFISAIAFIAGGILFFFALNFSTITNSGSVSLPFLGEISSKGTHKFAEANTENYTAWKLGTGAIVGGITAILAGIENIGRAILTK